MLFCQAVKLLTSECRRSIQREYKLISIGTTKSITKRKQKKTKTKQGT